MRDRFFANNQEVRGAPAMTDATTQGGRNNEAIRAARDLIEIINQQTNDKSFFISRWVLSSMDYRCPERNLNILFHLKSKRANSVKKKNQEEIETIELKAASFTFSPPEDIWQLVSSYLEYSDLKNLSWSSSELYISLDKEFDKCSAEFFSNFCKKNSIVPKPAKIDYRNPPIDYLRRRMPS